MKVFVVVSKYVEKGPEKKPMFTTNVCVDYASAHEVVMNQIKKIVGKDYIYDQPNSTTREFIVRRCYEGWVGSISHRFIITENEL